MPFYRVPTKREITGANPDRRKCSRFVSLLRKVVVFKTRSSLEGALASIKRSVEQSAPRR
jgi:hypothetical protein